MHALKNDGSVILEDHKQTIKETLGWLAHMVERLACNTRVIVDASSNLSVSRLKLL